jgi:hypothetical protein
MDTLPEVESVIYKIDNGSTRSPGIRASDKQSGPSIGRRKLEILESILSDEGRRPVLEFPSKEGFERPLRVSDVIRSSNEEAGLLIRTHALQPWKRILRIISLYEFRALDTSEIRGPWETVGDSSGDSVFIGSKDPEARIDFSGGRK